MLGGRLRSAKLPWLGSGNGSQLAMMASTTTRLTQPMANQNSRPSGLRSRMSSESSVSLCRDTTSSSMAANPGT